MLSDDEVVDQLFDTIDAAYGEGQGGRDLPNAEYRHWRLWDKELLLQWADIFERAARRIREVCGDPGTGANQ